MTLKDFLKRIDLDKDIDKMMIFSDGVGWTNIEVEVSEHDITIVADKDLLFNGR